MTHKNLSIWALYLAWVVSLAGALLSLYFGELRHMEPCRLCWMQRVALFPLAIQLGIFTYRKETNAAFYAIPLCVIGLAAAGLQSLDGSWNLHDLCGLHGSCHDEMIYLFGSIPITWTSGLGFFSIACLVLFSYKYSAVAKK